MPPHRDPDARLCNGPPEVRISDYHRMVEGKDTMGLSQFIKTRFSERYLRPMETQQRGGTGFAITALCCLTIEALESFRTGKAPREVKSTESFPNFFRDHAPAISRQRAHCGRGNRTNCSCFYHGVRCGILHMGETTGGWRIRSTNEDWLFVEKDMFLNAIKLQSIVTGAVESYAMDLSTATWNDRSQAELWAAFRRRMSWTLQHCEISPL